MEYYIENNDQTERMINTYKVAKKEGPQFKFGIQVPRNPKDALELDKKNSNTSWKDSMDTELKQLHDFDTF